MDISWWNNQKQGGEQYSVSQHQKNQEGMNQKDITF